MFVPSFQAAKSIFNLQTQAIFRLLCRFALEILISMVLCVNLAWQLYSMYQVYRKTGSALRYFANGWVYVDFMNNALLFTCMLIWWDRIVKVAKQLAIEPRYDVYESLTVSVLSLRCP